MVESHVPEILVKVYPAMLMNAQVYLMLMCRISIYPQNKLGNLEFEYKNLFISMFTFSL